MEKKQINFDTDLKYTIIDAMSATGLRAVRYFKELSKIDTIIANDLDPLAVEMIKVNKELNGDINNTIEVTKEDCTLLLNTRLKSFDVIDLDPYGSAAPMIDAALNGIKNNGLILATYTDMPVLCGNYPETSFYKYGSMTYKTSYCHEMAKRVALNSIMQSAGKYKKVIKPLVSFNAEFYIRLLFIVKDSPEECKENAGKTGYVYQCRQCQFRRVVPLGYTESKTNTKNNKVNKFKQNNLTEVDNKCPVCNGFVIQAGPIYTGELHDIDYVNELINTLNSKEFKYLKYNERILAFLNGMKDEHVLKDVVYTYNLSGLFRDIQFSTPKYSVVE